MGRMVSIDGVLCAPEQAVVSVYDRGFLYGDSVFETVRTYGGAPFALDEHLARLARSAERVAMELPVAVAVLRAEVLEALVHAANPESYARVMVTRGAGPVGLEAPADARPLRVILVEPLRLPPAAHYRAGIAAITVRTERAADAAHGAKVGNYLASLLALREARRAGAAEALLLDGAGNVLEGTTCNVFVVEGVTVCTPPEEAGILAGITRAHILAVARAAGMAVEEKDISRERLLAATEVFVCSSIREVVPVVAVDASPIGEGAPGPVTRQLHAAFRRAVSAPGPDPWR
ncbi:MAG: aminotransferase class IV [Polyangiaceae bacterium]